MHVQTEKNAIYLTTRLIVLTKKLRSIVQRIANSPMAIVMMIVQILRDLSHTIMEVIVLVMIAPAVIVIVKKTLKILNRRKK